MSDPGNGRGRRRRKRMLSAQEKYQIWQQLLTGELSQREAAQRWGVDPTTIMRIRKVARESALAGLAASKPGLRRQAEDAELAARIVELVENSERYCEMSAYAHRSAKRYDIARATGRLIEADHARVKPVRHAYTRNHRRRPARVHLPPRPHRRRDRGRSHPDPLARRAQTAIPVPAPLKPQHNYLTENRG